MRPLQCDSSDMRTALVQATFAVALVPSAAKASRRLRFIAKCLQGRELRSSTGVKSACRKPRPSNRTRTLDKCWEQPQYPSNVSELLGDLWSTKGAATSVNSMPLPRTYQPQTGRPPRSTHTGRRRSIGWTLP